MYACREAVPLFTSGETAMSSIGVDALPMLPV